MKPAQLGELASVSQTLSKRKHPFSLSPRRWGSPPPPPIVALKRSPRACGVRHVCTLSHLYLFTLPEAPTDREQNSGIKKHSYQTASSSTSSSLAQRSNSA